MLSTVRLSVASESGSRPSQVRAESASVRIHAGRPLSRCTCASPNIGNGPIVERGQKRSLNSSTAYLGVGGRGGRVGQVFLVVVVLEQLHLEQFRDHVGAAGRQQHLRVPRRPM